MDIWVERFIRAFVDFAAVNCSAAIALFLGGWQISEALGFAQSQERFLVGFFARTLLPLSLLFPISNTYFGLYTKSRGYTLNYKLKRAVVSAVVASLVFLSLSVLLNPPMRLSSFAAGLFFLLTVSYVPGVRWMKDWMFHRESESAAQVATPERDAPILVVGGAGYIGTLVVEKLLARGFKVRLLDNLVYGDGAIRHLFGHPRLEFIEGDCRNIQDVVRAMANVRNIIHLAAIVGDPACAEDGENASQINYAATRMMAMIAESYGIERFIFASTCSVYGASESLMDEASETNPISLYAQTKLQSEKVLLGARSKSFHPTVLRFATVFGLSPRPRFDLVVNLLSAKAVHDKVITVFNGQQWRPFIHVDDVAEAVVKVFVAPLESVSGEIFNVGDDRLNYTLREVAGLIREQLPQTHVEFVENCDRRNYRVAFSKVRERIGFEAERSLENGISEVIEAFRSGRISNYGHPSYSNLAFLKERGRVNAKDELDVKVMAAFASADVQTEGPNYLPQRIGTISPNASGTSRVAGRGGFDVAISGA